MLPRNLYAKLALSNGPPDTIRLCTARSELVPPSIELSLMKVALSDAPTYRAISYTWHSPLLPTGAEEIQHAISCDGEEAAVFPNLYQALLRFGQAPYRDMPFWIDAICIDQNNGQERSCQVDLMCEIYRQATEVVIWLGPSDEHVEPAKRLITALCALSDAERRQLLPNHLGVPTRLRGLQPELLYAKSYWLSLAQFLRRSWFNRSWVLQEVLLARKKVLLCGQDHELNWDDLCVVSDFLTTAAWRLAFTDPSWLGFREPLPYYNSATRLKSASRNLGTPRTLLRCLVHARSRDCSEDKDKVFSLYGVAATYDAPGIPRLKADYELTVEQAFIETAKYILLSSDDLHLLANAEGPRSPGFRLPSWVPDWTVKDPIGFKTGHGRYWAAGTLPKTDIKFPEDRILRLRAKQIALITSCAQSKRGIAEERNITQSLELLDDMDEQYHTNELTIEALWRTWLFDTGPDRQCPAPEYLSFSFRRWISERVRDNNQSVERHIAALESLLNSMKPSSSDDISSASFDSCFRSRMCLTLFRANDIRTNYRLLGLGPESVKSGDSIWLIPGSPIPLILREKADSVPQRYMLVGGSYLHGAMRPQASEQDKWLEFQEIDLV